MGLSKDNIDIIEEIKTLEITSAQKRRLRRKKLKAARAGSLETDCDKQKESLVTNKQLNTSDANTEKHALNNKKGKKCNTQVLNTSHNWESKTENSFDGHKTIPENKIISSNDLTSNDALLNLKSTPKDIKSTVKDSKYQKQAGEIPHIIDNQCQASDSKITKSENPIIIDLKKPNCESSTKVQNKKKTSKPKNPIENQQIKPGDICEIKNKKNNSNDSLSIENLSAVDVKVSDKEAIELQSPLSNKNQKLELNELVDIKKDKLNGDYNIVIGEQINDKLSTTECDNKVETSKFENQETEQKQTAIDNKEANLDKQEMGKTVDTPGSQKQQQGVRKPESKNENAAAKTTDEPTKSREAVRAAREAKKLAKQKAKKKDDTVGDSIVEDVEVKIVPVEVDVPVALAKDKVAKKEEKTATKPEKTLETVSDLKHKENIPPTGKKPSLEKQKKIPDEKTKDVKTESTVEKCDDKDGGKSKAELKAERRAKQEAQRAAKLAAAQTAPAPVPVPATAPAPAPQPEAKAPELIKTKEPVKPKPVEKTKSKSQTVQKLGWFQHLEVEKDKDALMNIPINSNLHPAVVRLGVQLQARVVTGANARCIALLDAIKKMVRDYSVPARTDVSRALQAQLAAAERHLRARRPPAAPDANALKHVRAHLTHLPDNVHEFDAKKQIQEEIDRYIREQIDMAGEAISLILRTKISPGDHILTYGCSSLIERALCSAWAAGVRFRATVAGARGSSGGEMLRRLRARGVPARYVDLAAVTYVMEDVQKVVLGAGALLAHGAALGAAGSAQVALVARARNVPVLVACETHKFSERAHLDPLAAHELGDPDELIDKSDECSPLRDWRSNPRLTLLNVTHDVTPPGLISAVVTELGILPCTSAPVVLRFKQAEYGL